MPVYDVKCKSCGFEEELWISIANLENALKQPCKQCNKNTLQQVINSAPILGYHYQTKKHPNWFNDKLKNIKDLHGSKHTTVSDVIY